MELINEYTKIAGNEIKIQGQNRLADFIRNDEVMLEELREQVNTAMGI